MDNIQKQLQRQDGVIVTSPQDKIDIRETSLSAYPIRVIGPVGTVFTRAEMRELLEH